MSQHDLSTQLTEQVRACSAQARPLFIRGGNSKAFYGHARVSDARASDAVAKAETLSLESHRGIVAYEPTELVISARAGTPLHEIEAALAAHNQMLPFEAPHFGPSATLGGMLACGLSGPRRPWGGSVRDAALGVKLLNGRGEVLRLGGQVMKNVAGYDVTRLMVGALGTLGVILEASVKVLPRPAVERTFLFESAPAMGGVQFAAPFARQLQKWARQALPISATLQVGQQLYLRLSGSESGLNKAIAELGGEEVDGAIWLAAREQTLPFFQGSSAAMPLWRISLPAAAPDLGLPGESLLEWGGAQRWLISDIPAARLRQRVSELGGHCTVFRGAQTATPIFQPLPAPMLALHQRIKRALDPQAIFNPGVLYSGL